jgi:hypothetical protein
MLNVLMTGLGAVVLTFVNSRIPQNRADSPLCLKNMNIRVHVSVGTLCDIRRMLGEYIRLRNIIIITPWP